MRGRRAGQSGTGWEAGGDRCVLVFDNATDPAVLRPFIPAAGAARGIITSNQQSMAALGTSVPVNVFSEQEALTFLAARTGQADAAGAHALAEQLGWLPLALAQAAAVIATQHLFYATYTDIGWGVAPRSVGLVSNMGDMAISMTVRAGATAIKRVEMSRPVRLGLEHGIIRPADDVFDYGCGHGHDVEFLAELGHEAHGWDPNHRPHTELRSAAVVHLGYVLNVIEDSYERSHALKEAWQLANRALIVAVRTTHEAKFVANSTEHADGLLTSADTFQKFYGQAEARAYIDDVLGIQSVPLAFGVFVAFKQDAAEQEWLENRAALRRRVRRLRRIVEPRRTLRDMAYETHRDVLRPLEEFIAQRGRLPTEKECNWTVRIIDVFGSLPRAFQVIRHVAQSPWWDDAAHDRRQELLVRFALARLRKRPKFTALPDSVQRDVRALFGSYKDACEQADDLLFSIGNPGTVSQAAGASPTGKRTPDSIYVHIDAIDLLPPPLRVFIGAAEALVGDVPEATLVKAHLNKPRVSYLVYPDFDTDPHPTLVESWVVDFHKLDVRLHNYRLRDNPPVLHRKDLLVAADHPRYPAFRRLTEQEERHGLLDEPMTIGTLDGWQRRLAETGWRLAGHRLVRI